MIWSVANGRKAVLNLASIGSTVEEYLTLILLKGWYTFDKTIYEIFHRRIDVHARFWY